MRWQLGEGTRSLRQLSEPPHARPGDPRILIHFLDQRFQILREQRPPYLAATDGGQGRNNTWLENLFLRFEVYSVLPLAPYVSEEGLWAGCHQGRDLEALC